MPRSRRGPCVREGAWAMLNVCDARNHPARPHVSHMIWTLTSTCNGPHSALSEGSWDSPEHRTGPLSFRLVDESYGTSSANHSFTRTRVHHCVWPFSKRTMRSGTSEAENIVLALVIDETPNLRCTNLLFASVWVNLTKIQSASVGMLIFLHLITSCIVSPGFASRVRLGGIKW